MTATTRQVPIACRLAQKCANLFSLRYRRSKAGTNLWPILGSFPREWQICAHIRQSFIIPRTIRQSKETNFGMKPAKHSLTVSRCWKPAKGMSKGHHISHRTRLRRSPRALLSLMRRVSSSDLIVPGGKLLIQSTHQNGILEKASIILLSGLQLKAFVLRRLLA